ncbi:MAG: hypothetical protein WCO60_19725 [Verrucomicrobiota bacterium]
MSHMTKTQIVEALRKDYGYFGERGATLIEDQHKQLAEFATRVEEATRECVRLNAEINRLNRVIAEWQAWKQSFPDRVAARLQENP